MAINLEKGGRINLKKEAPALKKVRLGLGWNANGTDTGTEFDLDVSVFICKNDHANMPKLISDEHFVFYNNKVSPDGAVVHHGDNRTGTGDGDDETVVVDLEKISAQSEELSFIVSIHEAPERKLVLQQSCQQAIFIKKELEELKEQITLQLSQVDQLLLVTIPAFEFSQK